MHAPAIESAMSPPQMPRRFFAPLPLAAWLVALLAAVVHLFPVLHARFETRPGYEFTGNVTLSPDYMQYRAWMRQTQLSGPLVDDKFTSEASQPYLPVIFYWALGETARAIDATPEDVYAYSGALFAFLLALLVFQTVRYFLPSGRGTWWVFVAILAGGGLGAHLKVLAQIGAVRESGMLGQVIGAVNEAPIFESYRSHYLFKTLFDSHFLLLWLVTVAAILGFYFALERFSVRRVLFAAGLCAVLTFLHVYEAFTLIVVFATIAFFCWRAKLQMRAAVLTAIACSLAMIACLAFLLSTYRSSGLPLPDWKPQEMPIASMVLAFPIAWLLMLFGGASWWRDSSLQTKFLAGWALGCALLSLSGPYFPYADRAPMTMQIPVWIIAGAIYFSRRESVSALGALVFVGILGVAPAYEVRRLWRATSFDANAPYMFLDSDRRATIDILKQAAAADVLLAEYDEYRWLAPEYPGKLYHGHFFLTVDFERKKKQVEQFFAAPREERAEFLKSQGVKFLYVNRANDPTEFEGVQGLQVLLRAGHGTVFEVR